MREPAKSIKVGGFEVPYLADGKGPLIVFSYVLGPIAWGSLDKLKERCTVAVLDWPESSAPLPFQASYSWYPSFLKTLGFEKGALCTWSMGAPSLVPYAANHPPELSHLILVDPAGLGGRPHGGLRDKLGIFSVKLAKRPTRMHVKNMWRHWVRSPKVDTGPLVDAHLRFLLSQSRTRQTRGSGLGPKSSSNLPRGSTPLGLTSYDALLPILERIEVPTLLLTGQYSTVLGPTLGSDAVKHLLSGKLVIFEESSHSLQLEEPDRFQQVLADFLTNRG